MSYIQMQNSMHKFQLQYFQRHQIQRALSGWAGGSLLSLLGVVLIPLMNKVFFNFLLSFLVAIAMGTLSGNAFLHLIPHVRPGTPPVHLTPTGPAPTYVLTSAPAVVIS